MWSDTLLLLERAHLVRLLAWGATSTIAGTALYAWTSVTGRPSPLLRHFSFQTGGWGLLITAMAIRGLVHLAERDLAGATRLDRLTWLGAGLDAGLIAVGIALAVVGWISGRRLGQVGGGIGLVVQGSALLMLHIRLLLLLASAL